MTKNRFAILLLVLFISSCTKSPVEKSNVPSNAPELTLAEKGKKLFASQNCFTCHSVDGSRLVGPSMKGVFNSEIKLAGGKTVKADEVYLRESIESPMLKIVEGYSPSMPVYKSMLSDADIEAIIEYIKSLQ